MNLNQLYFLSIFLIPSSPYLNQCSRTLKIVSEYDQEIPQSQTADNPVAPRGRAAQPSQDTRKTNQDDCNTRMDIK